MMGRVYISKSKGVGKMGEHQGKGLNWSNVEYKTMCSQCAKSGHMKQMRGNSRKSVGPGCGPVVLVC